MGFSAKINRVISWSFVAMFAVILFLNLVFGGIDYKGSQNFMLPNMVVAVIAMAAFGVYYFVKNRKDLTRKKFWILLAMISGTVLALQFIVQVFAFFRTGWDAGTLNDAANLYLESGEFFADYFTRYPNNLFLLSIFIILKKIFLVSSSVGLLVANAGLVSLAGIFTCLAVKNFTGSYKKGLFSYLITIPLILLSPWIIVPYSDTFAILFPILIIYLYSCKQKTLWHYFAIVFLGVIGYFIKPTVIITLIAIAVVEVVNNLDVFKRKLNYKRIAKCALCMMAGLVMAFGIKTVMISMIGFEPVEGVHEFNMTHFLAMGQNDGNNGMFADEDYEYSRLNGMGDNINKFFERISARGLWGNVEFFAKKQLVNYNNGTFAWGHEGTFYYSVPESESGLTDFLRSFLWSTGENYKYYAQFLQIIWITVLMLCPFIFKKKNSKRELVVMLSLMGITLFLLLFEARARYLYCFSPVFVLCAIVGAGNLKNYLMRRWEMRQRR